MTLIPSCFNANLAKAPATTREMVSRADERPRHGSHGFRIFACKYNLRVKGGTDS